MQEHAANLRSIGYFAAPYGKTVTPFTIPPETELVELICDGKIFFEIEGTRRTFGTGAMFWHVSGEKTIWDTPPENPYRCFVFVFGTHPPRRTVPRVSIWDSPDEAVDFSARMFKIFHEKEFDSEAFSSMIYAKLRWEALFSRTLKNETYPEPLRRACRFIEQNFRADITPEDAAEYAGISRVYLFRLFREYLAATPHRYLLKQRLDKAKLLLAEKKFSIKEISAECGFESIEVFYRHFRSDFHITPAEYRRKYSIHKS